MHKQDLATSNEPAEISSSMSTLYSSCARRYGHIQRHYWEAVRRRGAAAGSSPINWPSMKRVSIFTLLLGLVLCGCKEAGDTVENKSGNSIVITLTSSTGDLRQRSLDNGILYAMPRFKDATSPWRFYKLQVADSSGRSIGTLDVSADLRAGKYLDIVAFSDRLKFSRRGR